MAIKLWQYDGELIFSGKEFTKQGVLDELDRRVKEDWPDSDLYTFHIEQIGLNKRTDGTVAG